MCIDFEYDGQRLSDLGCMVCHILESGSASAISVGSQITFNTIPLPSLNKFKLSSATYDSAYTTTFEVCKYDCKSSSSNVFSDIEISYFMRWLNRKDGYKKFRMIYEDGTMAQSYYNGSFNVEPIGNYGDVIGLKLTLHTDAPFAYYDDIECTMEFAKDNLSYSFYDVSDEIGYIYPSSMTIEILQDGDFEMINSQEDRVTSIKNCVAGEVITLVNNLYLTSSKPHSTLLNDFNYVFPRICNENKYVYDYGYSMDNTENIFTVNMPCNITFTYSPICKMGIV